ncbi:hypothetical protein G6F56_003771 [Rhizopus delemar]|nr:hypothetical protein G6F56_003771 [Rhizopus delemar]
MSKKINLFFWHYFEFCGGCKTLPVALVEAGLFPLSPTKPSGAVHFGLCALLVRLRNIFAGSGEKISEFLSLQHQDFEKCLSAKNCSNIIILFSKMTELADEAVLKNVEEKAECPACLKASSSEPEDKRFIMLDGNFRLKGRRSLEEYHDLDKIDGLKNFNDVWLSNEDIAKYDNIHKSGLEEASSEARRFNTVANQKVTSTVYSVRGVFGSGCARHDTVYKLADITAGEGFKYPLACIQTSEKELNDKATLNIMYDIVCKLEPAIKREFSSLAGSGRLALSVFHAYAHVMHCQVKCNPRLIPNFGLTDGERMERLWSYMAKFITMTKPMLAENRKYVLYRNNAIKTNMAKAIYEKCNRLWKEQQRLKEVDAWSQDKLKEVAEKHNQHVNSVRRCGCLRESILDLVPANVEERIKYDLLLSVYIRFEMMGGNVVIGTTDEMYHGRNKRMIDEYLRNYELRNNIPRANRPFLITEEVTAIVEERWLLFLKQKEELFREIVRINVQIYMDNAEKLKSSHVGNRMSGKILEAMRKQKKQVETAIKAYNEENGQFLCLPASGNLAPLILHDVLKKESPLRDVEWSKDVAMWLRWRCLNDEPALLKRDVFWLRENIFHEQRSIKQVRCSIPGDDCESRGHQRILDEKLKANAKWRQVKMNALVAETNDEDEVDLADEGDEEAEEAEEEEEGDTTQQNVSRSSGWRHFGDTMET